MSRRVSITQIKSVDFSTKPVPTGAAAQSSQVIDNNKNKKKPPFISTTKPNVTFDSIPAKYDTTATLNPSDQSSPVNTTPMNVMYSSNSNSSTLVSPTHSSANKSRVANATASIPSSQSTVPSAAIKPNQISIDHILQFNQLSIRYLRLTHVLYMLLVLDTHRQSIDLQSISNIFQCVIWRANGIITENEFTAMYIEWINKSSSSASSTATAIALSSSSSSAAVATATATAVAMKLKRKWNHSNSVGIFHIRQLLLKLDSLKELDLDLYLGMVIHEINKQLLSLAIATVPPLNRYNLHYICNDQWLTLSEEIFFLLDGSGYGILSFDHIYFLTACLTLALYNNHSTNELNGDITAVQDDFSISMLSAAALQLMRDMDGIVTIQAVDSGNGCGNVLPPYVTLIQFKHYLLKKGIHHDVLTVLYQYLQQCIAAMSSFPIHPSCASPSVATTATAPVMRDIMQSLEQSTSYNSPLLWQYAVLDGLGIHKEDIQSSITNQLELPSFLLFLLADGDKYLHGQYYTCEFDGEQDDIPTTLSQEIHSIITIILAVYQQWGKNIHYDTSFVNESNWTQQTLHDQLYHILVQYKRYQYALNCNCLDYLAQLLTSPVWMSNPIKMKQNEELQAMAIILLPNIENILIELGYVDDPILVENQLYLEPGESNLIPIKLTSTLTTVTPMMEKSISYSTPPPSQRGNSNSSSSNQLYLNNNSSNSSSQNNIQWNSVFDTRTMNNSSQETIPWSGNSDSLGMGLQRQSFPPPVISSAMTNNNSFKSMKSKNVSIASPLLTSSPQPAAVSSSSATATATRSQPVSRSNSSNQMNKSSHSLQESSRASSFAVTEPTSPIQSSLTELLRALLLTNNPEMQLQMLKEMKDANIMTVLDHPELLAVEEGKNKLPPPSSPYTTQPKTVPSFSSSSGKLVKSSSAKEIIPPLPSTSTKQSQPVSVPPQSSEQKSSNRNRQYRSPSPTKRATNTTLQKSPIKATSPLPDQSYVKYNIPSYPSQPIAQKQPSYPIENSPIQPPLSPPQHQHHRHQQQQHRYADVNQPNMTDDDRSSIHLSDLSGNSNAPSSIAELFETGQQNGTFAHTFRDILRKMSRNESHVQVKSLQQIIKLGNEILAKESKDHSGKHFSSPQHSVASNGNDNIQSSRLPTRTASKASSQGSTEQSHIAGQVKSAARGNLFPAPQPQPPSSTAAGIQRQQLNNNTISNSNNNRSSSASAIPGMIPGKHNKKSAKRAFGHAI